MIKNNRKHFHAARPQNIIRYVDEQRQVLDQKREDLITLLPDLERLVPLASETIEVYEGTEGLKTVLEDILQSKKEIWTFGSEGNFSGSLRFYFSHYLRRLKKAHIKMKVIFSSRKHDIPLLQFANIRYLPEKYQAPQETTIYGEKTALFIFSETPKCIVILSRNATQGYRRHFEIMWKLAKP